MSITAVTGSADSTALNLIKGRDGLWRASVLLDGGDGTYIVALRAESSGGGAGYWNGQLYTAQPGRITAAIAEPRHRLEPEEQRRRLGADEQRRRGKQ